MTAVFFIIVFLAFTITLYTTGRFAAYLGIKGSKAAAIGIVCGLFSAAHQAILALGNYFDLSSLYYLLLGFAGITSFAILSLSFILGCDLLNLLSFFTLRSLRAKLVRLRTPFFIFAFLCFAAAAGLATYNAVRVPLVHTEELYYADLPEDLEGLKIVQVTDIHTSPIFLRERNEAIVRSVNELHADVVVFTGDQTDGTPEARGYHLLPVKNIRSRLGTFFISGNHEYITDFKDWEIFYKAHGLNLLINDNVRLKVGSSTLAVIGLPDDSASRMKSPLYETPYLEKALDGTRKTDFKLLLAHQPRRALEYSSRKYGIDLMLSGHTHGGQFFPLSFFTAKANQGFLKGLYEVGKMQLYVGQGAGLWCGVLSRLGTSSEITVFILKKQA